AAARSRARRRLPHAPRRARLWALQCWSVPAAPVCARAIPCHGAAAPRARAAPAAAPLPPAADTSSSSRAAGRSRLSALLAPGCWRPFGIEQPVEMDDEITHVRVIDGLLGLAFPGHIGGGVVGIDTDNIHCRQVFELGATQP